MTKYKLVLFDMDGTLLNGRTIFYLADILGFKKELLNVMRRNIQPYEKSIIIGKFLKGHLLEDLLEIYRRIPLNDNIEYVIKEFKKNNMHIAIATDSYKSVANDLKKRLKIDTIFANELVCDNKRFTGDLIIHNLLKKQDLIDNKVYSICKSCVLEKLCKKLSIKTDESIAIGDGIIDRGMLQIAGLGIAFNASDEVNKYGDVSTNKMVEILKYI